MGSPGTAAAWVVRGERAGVRDPSLGWIAGRVREGGGLVGPFKVLLARMVDGIRQGASEVSPSFADGLKVQRVLDAVRKSSEGGGWVRIE